MSILAVTSPPPLPTTFPATAPTTAPSLNEQLLATVLMVLVAAAIAGAVARMAGVFRRRSIVGPPRFQPGEAAGRLFAITALGAGVWLMTQAIFGFVRAAAWQGQHPGQRFQASNLGDLDFAFLATVPALLGLVALIGGDASAGGLGGRLGYRLSQFPRGLLVALLSLPIVLPLLWAGGAVLELIYRLIAYKHPTEHEMLGAMKAAPLHVRAILIFGATMLVPVFEEFLFRGHLQTLLVRIFNPAPRRGEPLVLGSVGAALSQLGGADDGPIPPPEDAPRRRFVWLAVVITSILFSSLHPSWSAPLIFILSVCLGYVYERTGNLWAAVLIHALFNASSTIAFLLTRS
ncbi:MAG TPA: type II CAAX endopeptidase family protein [Tepidisphaeraceae bacterium]|nr:type II CAAX endopeptidase family protein [Tepidisphaeraceae bacterium]